MASIAKLQAQVKKLREQLKLISEKKGLEFRKSKIKRSLGRQKKELRRIVHPARAELVEAIGKFFKHEAPHRLKLFAKEVAAVHSNPVAFTKMLAGNKSMTDAQKQKAFKTYIKKHGQRSSTLD